MRELNGVLMIIGGTDSGKSTFAHYLYQRLIASERKVAFLDGDPGQTFLGPPSTISLGIGKQISNDRFQPYPFVSDWDSSLEQANVHVLRSFVGSTTPRGHLAPMLIGCQKLTQASWNMGVDTLVYDTDGMIDVRLGGRFLKWSMIDLLQPQAVFAIYHGPELEPILKPFRHSHRTRLIELNAVTEVRGRSRSQRQGHRAKMFSRYFHRARMIEVDWTHLAVFPSPNFHNQQLVAFEDKAGYVLGLGTVKQFDPELRKVQLRATVQSLADVDALRLGDLLVDPHSYSDQLFTE